jgi:hypothetical protein
MDFACLLYIGCGAYVVWFGFYTRRHLKKLNRRAQEARAEAVVAQEAARQARAVSDAYSRKAA